VSLTRVSPALFATSNNITSVTVGGSANTISLTFDSNGVITGASNNALSVANTAITGLIQAAQIGSANATLVTSGTLPGARLPAGSVLQVVNGTYSTSATSVSATYADTGLTATITPSSVSSKILVFANQQGCQKYGVNTGLGLKLFRGATELAKFEGQLGINSDTAYSENDGGCGITYLDSPSTTSATAYKTQFNNRSAAGTVGVQADNATSTITLMEIAG
jgi:hypothetical protein